MKKTLSFIFILFLSLSLKAQSIYSCTNGEVTFYSKAPIEDIDATSQSMNSILNTANSEIVFIVPMTSFKFKKAMMQEHFNDKYVESDKFPTATYKGKINETIVYAKDAEYEITSTGLLTIHGVEQQRTEKGRLSIKDGNISVQSEFNVALKDHNIQIPKLLMENIAEEVKVNFSANYAPFKKDK